MSPRQKIDAAAAIAQLGERQTEHLKVPGSIPGLGKYDNVPTTSKLGTLSQKHTK